MTEDVHILSTKHYALTPINGIQLSHGADQHLIHFTTVVRTTKKIGQHSLCRFVILKPVTTNTHMPQLAHVA